MTFEYKYVELNKRISNEGNMEAIMELLNQHGKQDWKLDRLVLSDTGKIIIGMILMKENQ